MIHSIIWFNLGPVGKDTICDDIFANTDLIINLNHSLDILVTTAHFCWCGILSLFKKRTSVLGTSVRCIRSHAHMPKHEKIHTGYYFLIIGYVF